LASGLGGKESIARPLLMALELRRKMRFMLASRNQREDEFTSYG
jgi:hypothetical protein